jgi:hypothetical protein
MGALGETVKTIPMAGLEPGARAVAVVVATMMAIRTERLALADEAVEQLEAPVAMTATAIPEIRLATPEGGQVDDKEAIIWGATTATTIPEIKLEGEQVGDRVAMNSVVKDRTTPTGPEGGLVEERGAEVDKMTTALLASSMEEEMTTATTR